MSESHVQVGDLVFGELKRYDNDREIRIERAYFSSYLPGPGIQLGYAGRFVSRNSNKWVFAGGGDDEVEDFNEADLVLILEKLKELNAQP